MRQLTVHARQFKLMRRRRRPKYSQPLPRTASRPTASQEPAYKNRQPADTVEALRLAACVSACLQSFATKANLVVQQNEINSVVAKSVR